MREELLVASGRSSTVQETDNYVCRHNGLHLHEVALNKALMSLEEYLWIKILSILVR